MNRTLISTFIIAFMLSGCTKDNTISPVSDQVVVRGYLYAGEPVTDIQLTSLLSLGSQDTIAPPVNNAQVSLLKNNHQYDLVASAGDSGYYHYEGNDLTVEAGDQFTIQVAFDNHQISGTTQVPEAPQNVTIAKTTLSFPDMDSMWEQMQQGISMDSMRQMTNLTVSWEKVENALYYIVVENIDENPVEFESNFGPGPGFGGGGPGRFISQPIATDEYSVNAMMMTHYGKHQVKVYRVNQEYADLYQSRNQDSRDLNEPLTNINNGLGVFSAFNSTCVYFTLE